jgi:hypothetical protein
MNRSTLLLVGLAVVVFLVAGAAAIHKPPSTDEAEFAAAGLGVAHTGRPIYYMGEVPERLIPESDRWLYNSGGQPHVQLGLWHASIYVFLIGLCYRLFGPENWAARLTGAVCLGLDLWLLLRILRQLMAAERYAWTASLMAILFLANPFLLQEGLMLDIDNTVMTAALLFFLHEYLRMERPGLSWLGRVLRLAVLLSLISWAKELAGAYALVAACGYEILARRWRRVAALLIAAILGVALFAALWIALCRALHVPADYFIAFSIKRRLAKADGVFTQVVARRGLTGAFVSIGKTLVHSATWVSPFWASLGLIALASRVRQMWRRRAPEPVDLLTIFVLFLLLLAKIVRPSGWFLKYEYPAYAPLTLLIALWLAPRLSCPPWRRLVVAGILMIAVAWVQVVALGDPVSTVYDLVVSPHATASVLMLFYVVLGAALVGILFVLNRRRWQAPEPILTAALIIGTLGAQLGLAWKQHAPYTTAPNWPNYAEPSFAPVVARLRNTLRPGDVPVCRKDIGYALRLGEPLPAGRWIDNAVVARLSTPRLPVEILAPEVTHVVLDRYSTRGDPARFLQPTFAVDFETDGYLVLRRERAP